MTTLVTGATGLLGRRLVRELGAGVVALSRDASRAAPVLPDARIVAWDARSTIDASAFDGVDVVFHLAGEPVAEGRWTEEKKRRLLESRTLVTRALVDSMRKSSRRPRVLVNASAVGVYGSRGDEVLTEDSAPGSGFLADVCKAWEAEAAAASELGIRVVCVRTGIVLARDGGALARMLPLFKAGVAGPLASGKQWMPWLHIDDAVGLLRHAASSDAIHGPMNACAPEPVTNRDFTRTLGAVVSRPTIFPVPRIALRVAFGETADVVLASQRAVPKRALATGYVFRHPDLREALEDLCGRAARGTTRPAHA